MVMVNGPSQFLHERNCLIPLCLTRCRTAVELSSRRANGLLSPALSSKGGEGDIPAPVESTDAAAPLLLGRRGGLNSATVGAREGEARPRDKLPLKNLDAS